MSTALTVCHVACGGFFLVGLICGVWKYAGIRATASGEARAPVYVDVAHRASLLYAFACLVLARFVELSRQSAAVETIAVSVSIALFASAVLAYIVHGILGDTDNQFAKPHRLGRRTLPAPLMTGFMVVLIVGEIGGFGVLFVGYLSQL